MCSLCRLPSKYSKSVLEEVIDAAESETRNAPLPQRPHRVEDDDNDYEILQDCG